MADEPILKVTRESLSSGIIRKMAVERNDGDVQIASDEELLVSRRTLVPDNADCEDIWIFGYGSLIFNPVVDYVERRQARIFGHHRRFCLWTRLGRGSPDCPGLVLALDRGGSCTGIAFRLNPETAVEELDLLWRREMITMAYRAQWLTLHTEDGQKRAIGFIARPERQNYAKTMSIAEEAAAIAAATGFIGPCRDYLFDTVDALRANGIKDPHLENLARQVKLRLATDGGVG